MDPRAVLDTEEEKNIFFLQGIESQFIFQPAVWSLYRLDYPNTTAYMVTASATINFHFKVKMSVLYSLRP
jgi:hypothetical protein